MEATSPAAFDYDSKRGTLEQSAYIDIGEDLADARSAAERRTQYARDEYKILHLLWHSIRTQHGRTENASKLQNARAQRAGLAVQIR
jgi:hypothetical protein